MNVINKMFGWKDHADRTRKLAYAITHPIPPVVVDQKDAPVQEEVYEKPATQFVAGFVGTSNLLKDDAATAVIGKPGIFTVRPEKIRITDPDAEPAADELSALGDVREVVYLGSDTRYIVSLQVGGELVVTQQNLQTSSMDALAAQGRPVRLTWKRQHVLSLAAGQESEGDEEGVEDQ